MSSGCLLESHPRSWLCSCTCLFEHFDSFSHLVVAIVASASPSSSTSVDFSSRRRFFRSVFILFRWLDGCWRSVCWIHSFIWLPWRLSILLPVHPPTQDIIRCKWKIFRSSLRLGLRFFCCENRNFFPVFSHPHRHFSCIHLIATHRFCHISLFPESLVCTSSSSSWCSTCASCAPSLFLFSRLFVCASRRSL